MNRKKEFRCRAADGILKVIYEGDAAMKLLIADDEAVIRRGILSLDWKSIGIDEVFSVSNGEEARELLLAVPVDIVIFDIRMPGMTGLELAAMIKEYSMDMAAVRRKRIGKQYWAEKRLQTLTAALR